MATIISVSLAHGQKEFIDEMGISASELLQRSINEIFENSRISQEAIKDYQKKILRLQELITKYGDFVEKRGLNEEWLKQNGY